MNTTLEELYRDTLRAHRENPRFASPLSEKTASFTVHNRICGDEVCVELGIPESTHTLAEIAALAKGCAICCASASLMSEAVVGRTLTDTFSTIRNFRNLILSGVELPHDDPLAVFLTMHAHPARHRCALLPWEALAGAIEGVKP